MNAKKCKKVRKQLRSIGADVRQAEGAIVSGFSVSTLKLEPTCGRAFYKRLKSRLCLDEFS